MPLYHNIKSKPIINISLVYETEQLIIALKKRFSSYGYDEINTSSFERYDLYAQMNGTVNLQEMIKTIDNNGQVLVLRPDVTIPITQQIASNNTKLTNDLRYFYAADVFRQDSEVEDRTSRQAGVEYFGNSSSEADAEIIALAIHSFNDLNITNFNIELGHAGFFKAIIDELKLKKSELSELKKLIQAKNVTGITPFLEKLNVAEDLKAIIEEIPFLYGKPEIVIERAKQLPLTELMTIKLDNLSAIFNHLTAYNAQDKIVIDLGLINHMDYYSDMIFQGFTENVARPVLMGGRYDTLADQFLAHIPASGFAFDVDKLLLSIDKSHLKQHHCVDSIIYYEEKEKKAAFTLAGELRNNHLRVLTYPIELRDDITKQTKTNIILESHLQTLMIDNEVTPFNNLSELMTLINELEERK